MFNVNRLLILTLCLGLVPGSLFAATPEETEANLTSLRDTLSKSNAKVSEITAALAEALKAQAELSTKLVSVGQNIQDQKAAIAGADVKIASLQSRSLQMQSDLSARQNELSALLSGLMHLQANPPPAIVVAPSDALSAVRGAMVFNEVVPEVEARRQDLKAKLDELQALREATTNEKQKQQDSVTSLAKSEQELKALQDDKHRFAEAAGRDLASEKLNAESLAAKAGNMEQLLAALRKAKDDDEKRKSVEAKAAAEAAAKAEADRLEALRGPLKPLASLKGQLIYPVEGDVIKNYGDQTSLGTKLEGLAFATPPQAIVNAPVDGKVEFAGSFRSYGQLLILDAGGGYLVLLAGMNKISADIGQSVRIGEPLGVMGEGPSTIALLGDIAASKSPIFYVEFRKDNAPVDSTPWWSNGKREAMQ